MKDLNNFHKITVCQHDALLECYFEFHPNKLNLKQIVYLLPIAI